MTAGRDPNAVSIGPGTLYTAPLGTVEPTTLTGALNAAWIDLGYTEAGTVFTTNMTTQPVMVDEEFTRLKTIVTDKNGQVSFALSQITSYNMQIAYAGGTIVTAGGVTTFTPPAAGAETRVMLLWKAKAGDELYVWRQCFQSGNVATNRKKSTPQALLPVTFELEKPAGLEFFVWIGSTARSGS